jgi:EpsI family protein
LGAVLAFPLFFLFFAVPIGEGLVAPMMEFTATSTVWMIQMTGIPVYREGLYFSLPTGHWSVVEACSGVRYIIASITVGVLYAYLTYRSWTRRLLFVLISAIMPIFANTIRAYIIVMLGHMSDMTIATGADHLVYGWVFFGLVIFLLFWVGSFFREDHLDEAPVSVAVVDSSKAGTNRMLVATFFSTLMLASVAPFLAYQVFGPAVSQQHAVSFPASEGDWRDAAEVDWGWSPYSRVSGHSASYYTRGDDTVGVIVQFPDGSVEGADVIGSSPLFAQLDSDWRVISQNKMAVQGPDGEMLVDVAEIRAARDKLLVWSWYVVGDTSTSNDYQAKLQQTLSRLGFGSTDTYRVIVVTPLRSKQDHAQERLQDFVMDYIPLVYQSLRQATPSVH